MDGRFLYVQGRPFVGNLREAATKWYASDKENGKCKRNCDTSDDDNIDLQYIFYYALSLYLYVFIGH